MTLRFVEFEKSWGKGGEGCLLSNKMIMMMMMINKGRELWGGDAFGWRFLFNRLVEIK